MNYLREWMDDFLSSGMQISELSSKKLRQVRLINEITVLLIAFAFLLIAVFTYLNFFYLVAVLLISIATVTVNIIRLRTSHMIIISAHITLITLTVAIFLGCIIAGHTDSLIIWWILIIPVISATIHEKSLLFYSTLSFTLLLVLYILYWGNIIPIYVIPDEQMAWFKFLSVGLEMVIISLSLSAYIKQYSYYEMFLERRNQSLKETTSRYYQMAHIDNLTNLANRAYFYKTLQNHIQNIKHKTNSPNILSVLYMDIDGMKSINDTYGHQAGDSVLFYLSKRLKSCFRASDTVARLGGDEFAAIVLDKESENLSHSVANRILKINQKPIRINNETIPIKLSIGIASFPKDSINSAELVEKADKALYFVKHHGGNAYESYSAKVKTFGTKEI